MTDAQAEVERLHKPASRAQQLRAAMDQWSTDGGIPPGRYRVHAEIGVERRQGYEVLVPGDVEHGVKVGGLLNLGLVLLEPMAEVLEGGGGTDG